MLIEMPGVLMADEPGQNCSDQATGAAGDGRRRERDEDRAAGGGDREASGYGRCVDPGPDDGTLRIADRLDLHTTDPRRVGIVLEFGGRLIGATEFRGDRIFMREHVDVGTVESSQQQIVDGSLEGLNIVEDCNGFRLARTVVRLQHGSLQTRRSWTTNSPLRNHP